MATCFVMTGLHWVRIAFRAISYLIMWIDNRTLQLRPTLIQLKQIDIHRIYF